MLKKKEINAQIVQHVLADGQLLIYVADAVSPSNRYLCLPMAILFFVQGHVNQNVVFFWNSVTLLCPKPYVLLSQMDSPLHDVIYECNVPLPCCL